MFLAVEMANGSFSRGERLDVAFSCADLVIEPDSVNAKNFAPFRNAVLNAVNLYENISSRIPHLLFRSSPAAVFWAIIAIHVFPIDGMLRRRLLSHVSQKRLKRVLPLRAYNNAPTAIERIFVVIRIIAASLKQLPSAVFWRSCAAVGLRMFVVLEQVGRRLFRQAATAKRGSTDICRRSNCSVSAVAFAPPHGVVGVWHLYPFKSNKAPEPLVLYFSHESSPNSYLPIYKMGMEYNEEKQ